MIPDDYKVPVPEEYASLPQLQVGAREGHELILCGVRTETGLGLRHGRGVRSWRW
jgi:hypothetical protein